MPYLPYRLKSFRIGTPFSAVALACALAVLIRAPFFYWPITVDEAAYAYAAYWWFHGFTLYSQDLWLDRPQGIFLAYQLGMSLFGDSALSIRLWGALWAAATTGTVYFVAKHLFSQRAGIAASLVFAVFSAASHIEGFTANAETFMVLATTLSAYFLLTRKFLLAGFLASIAVLLKPPGSSIFILALAWLLFQRAAWRGWWWFLCGAFLPALLALGHGILTVGFDRYVDSVALLRFRAGWTSPDNPLLKAAVSWIRTTPVWLPLFALAIPGVYKTARQTWFFALVWLLSSVLGMTMSGQWFPHYFTQLMPPLAVCAGAGIERVWVVGRWWARSQLVVILLAFFLLFEGPFYVQPPKEGMWNMFHRRGYQISEEVSGYINSHTQEDDTIYVAFAQADIYYSSRRRSSFPYLFIVQVMHLPGVYSQLIDTIQARKPMYVLALDPPLKQLDPEDRFWRALEKGYEIEETFQGVPLYRRRNE